MYADPHINNDPKAMAYLADTIESADEIGLYNICGFGVAIFAAAKRRKTLSDYALIFEVPRNVR